jgi:Leu/Phe-tRNA-protein transferase
MNPINKNNMVFQLTQKLVFPDPHYGEPDGLLAVGGDLSVDRLLLAYSNGIFPWYAFREKQIQWWCPLKRFVIFPNEIHISHSMRTFMNKEQYGVSFNQAFHEVIQTCGNLRMEETGAWLGKDIMKAYIRLHEQGFRDQRGSMGRILSGRRTLWSHFGKVFFW